VSESVTKSGIRGGQISSIIKKFNFFAEILKNSLDSPRHRANNSSKMQPMVGAVISVAFSRGENGDCEEAARDALNLCKLFFC
jgi:hypothetical protein